VVFGLTGPSPGPPVSARQITKSPSTYSQKLCATVLRTISETDRKLIVCRAVFNSAVSLMIYRPLRRKTYCVSLSPKESRRMTVIEIKPHRMGWKVFEAPGVEPFACARRAFFTQPRCEVVRDRLRNDFAV